MIGLFDVLGSREFRIPFAILLLIFLGEVFSFPQALILGGLVGLFSLLFESWGRLRHGKWNLDYLAFLALVVAFFLEQWLAGAVLALMAAVSAALETYGTRRAEKTLRELFEKIPKTVMVRGESGDHEVSLHAVVPGDTLVLRRGEMLPFEAELLSNEAVFDESNVTGEVEPAVHRKGGLLKAGFVNRGEIVLARAEGDFEHSSYRKILKLVDEGKHHPAPLARLSERYNILFTIFSLAIAFAAYFFSGDLMRFLAVLVIATPCPLLIAAPMSFIGGLNKAARKNIIIKSPFILELLASTKTILFDKTGTLTLGEPRLRSIHIFDKHLDEEEALNIAASLERHSIHPIAKAFVRVHSEAKGEILPATHISEEIGKGIRGTIHGSEFSLRKATVSGGDGIVVELYCGKKRIASFTFDDILKPAVGEVFGYLTSRGYRLGIITGDKEKNARRVLGHFRLPLYADATPERKASLIARYQKKGELVGMIGDGVNDAPALALADLGIVFSGTENSAATEAADVAILDRDALRIRDAIHIGRSSYRVAFQSIVLGMALSTGGMTLAFFGYVDPVQGAVLQEVIDFCVIMNALRSTY
ncbi:MAG: cadmium-translocating P-type ATPase [Candidatus Moranbacteria bacterium RIFCSPHIGHO2_01_FULL_55_24]|nr:MAG: cadmium-translocating P-type ATPase [Candidatus Moranbacteria bacterium RIFCSPHIGHO2_01_FULL_55_24]